MDHMEGRHTLNGSREEGEKLNKLVVRKEAGIKRKWSQRKAVS